MFEMKLRLTKASCAVDANLTTAVQQLLNIFCGSIEYIFCRVEYFAVESSERFAGRIKYS